MVAGFRDLLGHPTHEIGGRRGSMKKGDPVPHGVGLQGVANVRTNLPVDGQHASVAPDELQHRCQKHDAAALVSPGDENDVGLDFPDQRLKRDQAFRGLVQSPPKPRWTNRHWDPCRSCGAFLNAEAQELRTRAQNSRQPIVAGWMKLRPPRPQFATRSSTETNGVNGPWSCGYGVLA